MGYLEPSTSSYLKGLNHFSILTIPTCIPPLCIPKTLKPRTLRTLALCILKIPTSCFLRIFKPEQLELLLYQALMKCFHPTISRPEATQVTVGNTRNEASSMALVLNMFGPVKPNCV